MNLEQTYNKARKLIPRFSKRIAPLYAALRWGWSKKGQGEPKVPTEDMIALVLEHLMDHSESRPELAYLPSEFGGVSVRATGASVAMTFTFTLVVCSDGAVRILDYAKATEESNDD